MKTYSKFSKLFGSLLNAFKSGKKASKAVKKKKKSKEEEKPKKPKSPTFKAKSKSYTHVQMPAPWSKVEKYKRIKKDPYGF